MSHDTHAASGYSCPAGISHHDESSRMSSLNSSAPVTGLHPRRLVGKLFSSQLRINIASGLATTVVNVLVMALSYPLYLHFLGYAKVGVWLLLSSVQIFAQLGLAGLGPVLTKLVAEERGRNNSYGAQQYLSLATIIHLAAGATALSLLLAFATPIVNSLGLSGDDLRTARGLLPWVAALTAFSFLNQVTISGLAGIGRIDLSNYVVTGSKLAALAVEATLLIRGNGVFTLLIGDMVGCATIHFAGNHILASEGGLHLLRRCSWDRVRLGKLLNFGGNMLIASLTTLLVSPLNKIALSRYGHLTMVPVYDIAFNGSMQLRGLAEVSLRAIMPAVSHRHASDDADAAASVVRLHARAVKLMLLMSIPGYLISLPLAAPLLRLWLGSRFVPAIVPTFQIMLGAALINLLAVPAYFTLMGAGRMSSCMVSHLVSALANVAVLGVALGVHHTVTIRDAAVAVLATMSASSLFLLWRTLRLLRSHQL